MNDESLDIPAAVLETFTAFIDDNSLLALPLVLANGSLEALSPVQIQDPNASFQTSLNQLDAVLSPRASVYLLLRQNSSLKAITYVPYLAKESQRIFLLKHRHTLIEQLGKEHFNQSLICKEICEITDARSWTERANNDSSNAASERPKAAGEKESSIVKDTGYKRNKYRLCDRRMKNKITPDAFQALKTLVAPGTLVQLSIDPSTSTLTLTLSKQNLPTSTSASSIAPLIPDSSPTYTFFHHPSTHLLYIISLCPDAAPVQQRMQHVLGLPGVLVHAGDAGVVVDRGVEVHEPGELELELEFGRGEGRGGRGRGLGERSVYVRCESGEGEDGDV